MKFQHREEIGEMGEIGGCERESEREYEKGRLVLVCE